MVSKYYYGKHFIDSNDIKEILKTLKSGIISQGSQLDKLEKNVAKYCGVNYCVAVSSGTAALHLSVLSLNFKKNFLALTSPITFAATPNSVIACGGKIDCVDINKETFNLDENKLEQYLRNKKNKKPKLIIPVNFGGQSPNMKQIYKIAKKNNIKIIEDASQAMGGLYNNNKIGSCEYSDLTVFSLHPVKSITSGEGGLILTNNKNLYEKIKLLKLNGVKKTSKPSWYHDVKTFGLNYKISELNCALANSQLKKIDKFVNKRNSIAKFYEKNLDSNIYEYQKILGKSSISARHLFIIKFKNKINNINKNIFYNTLKKMNIILDIKYRPLNLMSFYKKNFKLNDCPSAKEYFQQTFCIPIYQQLNIKDLKYIVKSLNITAKKLKL